MKENMSSPAWKSFINKYDLTDIHVEKFKKYIEFLKKWNKKFNLTAIEDDSGIIKYHFDDSLSLSQFVDCKELKAIADIGSGAGFPGVPLKIMYPHLKLLLIEVNGKKVRFLQKLVEELDLSEVVVEQTDWRTFTRSVNFEVDLFCARASLQMDELHRMFKPSSIYKDSKLVYWAASTWQPSHNEKELLVGEFDYQVGERHRKLVLFENALIQPGE